MRYQQCLKILSITINLASAIPKDDVVSTVTVGPAIPTAEPEWKDFPTFTSAILNSTNVYRKQHDAGPLSWNDTLADFASDYLADAKCNFEHSGGPYGENLAMGYPNATTSVEAWGDEREEYSWKEHKFTEKTGHFTQLVWNDTREVGCGRRLCGEKGWYLVCEYWPRGNVGGEYEDEVGKEVGAVGKVRPDYWILGMAFAVFGSVFYMVFGDWA